MKTGKDPNGVIVDVSALIDVISHLMNVSLCFRLSLGASWRSCSSSDGVFYA